MPTLSSRQVDCGIMLCLLTLALVLGLYVARLGFDDPFVAYRYGRDGRCGNWERMLWPLLLWPVVHFASCQLPGVARTAMS